MLGVKNSLGCGVMWRVYGVLIGEKFVIRVCAEKWVEANIL
jgi:hypothetical protein